MSHTAAGRNPFRTTLKPWLKPLSAGTYKKIIVAGFLRWCEMDFVHPQGGGESTTNQWDGKGALASHLVLAFVY